MNFYEVSCSIQDRDKLFWFSTINRALIIASSAEEAKSLAKEKNSITEKSVDAIWDIEDLGVVESGIIEWAYGGEY